MLVLPKLTYDDDDNDDADDDDDVMMMVMMMIMMMMMMIMTMILQSSEPSSGIKNLLNSAMYRYQILQFFSVFIYFFKHYVANM